MNDDDFERRIFDAFAAKAHAEISDATMPPPLTTRVSRASTPTRPAHHRRGWLAPLAAAAAVAAVVVGVAFVSRDQPAPPEQAGAGPTAPPSASASISAPAAPVHVALKFSDGGSFGVGIPIVAYLSKTITNGKAFAAATRVTVDGAPAKGAWYFQASTARRGYPLEAHYRLPGYWPAHSKIALSLPIKGVSAGPGLAFDTNLALHFATGAANVATVDDRTHLLSLVSDGQPAGSYPVSLGATATPTSRGIKVIMEKGAKVCMSGPGYRECGIKWTQRLTNDGEYLLAGPWNAANLGRVDSSNGSTNLSTTDAATLYKTLEIGDVVTYPNANGPTMSLGAGYGDWNVPWSQWLTGGAVPTS